jgi:3-methyladenine DNA glycosylase/8-oxoguanine DNA glycosylase
VRPPLPLRLPTRGTSDGVTKVRGGVISRLLHAEGAPVLVRAWAAGRGLVRLRADSVRPDAVDYPVAGRGELTAGQGQLRLAIERMRFALALDDDLRPFFRRFRSDPLLGKAIGRRPWVRPRRQPWPWEALAWAIPEQLIESPRAAAIKRRITYRWGPRLGADSRVLLPDLPCAATLAGRAPAELVGMDLSEGRALALIRAAREVAAGRVDPASAEGDRRLLAIREIGPWTVQMLGLRGRGDPDSLPAGDLAFVKLVGVLTGLGRKATVEEVEEFFAPYAPYRGLAGTFALVAHHRQVAAGPPLRRAA